MVLRELVPSVAHQLAEAGSFAGNSTLQRAVAHTQVFRHLAEIDTLATKEPQQDPFLPGQRPLFATPSAPPAHARAAQQERKEFGVVAG
jgi:hypothetical protein